jgi:hypothetical protein
MEKTLRFFATTIGATGLAIACSMAGEEPARADNDRSTAQGGHEATHGQGASKACSFRRTRGTYGFQCFGSQLFAAPGLPPAVVQVTDVGSVYSDGEGGFAGRGTINLPLGSLPLRFSGGGTIDADCFGRVTYDVLQIELPAGSGNWIALPPMSFDGAIVDGGQEILVTQVAPGATGDAVPHFTCRLVHVRDDE